MAYTMTSLRLYRTMAKLYNRCISLRTPSKDMQMTQMHREDLCTFLIEGYQSQLKWIATQKNVMIDTNSNENRAICSEMKNLDLHSARSVLLAWEEAQFNAMSLIKHANSALYQSWCAFATVQHWKTCKLLLQLLKSDNGDDMKSTGDKDEEEVKKLEQKVKMLPRLADMMMQRVCSTSNDKFPPSADDWRLYLECLTAQGKLDDAIEILSAVKCGTAKQGRQIDDEQDVKHHLGSLIQMSERERIEMISELNIKLGRYDVASSLYIDKLLELLPDQWSYWEAVVKCFFKTHDMSYDNVAEDCNKVLDHVINKQELLRSEGKASRVPIRGPYLCRVYLIAEGIRQCNRDDGESLCNAIIAYGNMFSSLVSCCFQDLRSYIVMLVTASKNGYKSQTLSRLIDSVKRIREENNLSVEPSENKEQSSVDIKERRSKLRAYIFSIKVCFEVWYQCLQHCEDDHEKEDINNFFSDSVPSVDDMVCLWGNVLDLGSNPDDGGQKETLPGDDLILLANQLVIYQNSCQPEDTKHISYMLSATILEAALSRSPYNPYIKIAAIRVYSRLGAVKRAFEIFDDMNISHVQLDSCSYIILRRLVNNILCKEAVNVAGKILNLHTASARDVSKFMPKSFDNGNLQKGLEMISWQRFEMNHSAQLLQAKSIIMNLAPLLTADSGSEKVESFSYIGAINGICGDGSRDVLRAEKFVRNAANHQAAPSLIQYANFKLRCNNIDALPLSDNRDLSINQFEILDRTFYDDSVDHSLISANINSILTRVVLFVDVCKAPKKGKVVKFSAGDTVDIRAKSLLQSLANTNAFFGIPGEKPNIHAGLWKVMLCLCKTICALGAGIESTEEENIPADDSIAQRESRCTILLNSARENIQKVICVWELLLVELRNEEEKSELLCNVCTELLLPAYAILRTTANLFGIYAWGKRKRKTKKAVDALANVALMFKKLLDTMDVQVDSNEICLQDMAKDFLSVKLPKSSISVNLNEGGRIEKIAEVCKVQKADRDCVVKNVFREMMQELETFNVDD